MTSLVEAGTNKKHFDRLTILDGLSQSSIFALHQDHRGFIWIGTEDGLNRYDGYRFTVYRHDPGNPYSMSDNAVRALCGDEQGRLWIGTRDGGLNLYDRHTDTFTSYLWSDDVSTVEHRIIYALAPDGNGGLWLGTTLGVFHFDPVTTKFRLIKGEDRRANKPVLVLLMDSHKKLWVGNISGLYTYDPVDDSLKRYPGNQEEIGLIRSIYEDREGQLWIGAKGLYQFHRQHGVVTVFKHPLSSYDEERNIVLSIFEDRYGAFWVGTRKGLWSFNKKSGIETVYRTRSNDPTSISGEKINTIMEDDSGLLWIGTHAAGLNRLNREKERFSSYTHDSMDLNSLSSKNIWSIMEDDQDNLWIGTFSEGLNRFDRKKNRITRFRHNPKRADSLSSNQIRSLYQDPSGRIWVGTRNARIDLFDPETDRFTSYDISGKDIVSSRDVAVYAMMNARDGKMWVGTRRGLKQFHPDDGKVTTFVSSDAEGSLSSSDIRMIHEDAEGIFWICTHGGGINRFDRETGTFTATQHDPNSPSSLIDNNTYGLVEDFDGNMWIATDGGLERWTRANRNQNRNVFTHYREEDGIANTVVYSVLMDDRGLLWLSTNHGISRFDPETERFRNYDTNDGISCNEFNTGAFHKSRKGELFFGGVDGVTAFFPNELNDNPHAPPIVLTDLQILNAPVPIGPDSPLKQHITETTGLTLYHQHHVFSLEFAGLRFQHPEKNLYAYKMEGFDDAWIYSDSRRFVTYTNLEPGNYTFRAKGCNHDGVWNEKGVSLNIKVKPPSWKSWWAYTLYMLLLTGFIFVLIRAQLRKLAFERKVNERLMRINRLKDEFLANTSHELKTPLNGIIGLAESLIDGAAGPVNASLATNLSMIVSSGRRLSTLVNDILDFSKLRDRELVLQTRPLNLQAVTDMVLTLSRPLLGSRPVTLVNEVPDDIPTIEADENRLQQILFNLVGNAIKFTSRGTVRITARESGDRIQVAVSDTGMGIDPEKTNQIFDAFEQGDSSISRSSGGTGLGLAITRQLVELHGGSIWVVSNPGEGSTFFFTLSRAEETAPWEIIQPLYRVQDEPIEPERPATPRPKEEDGRSYSILIVDDEPVNRQVLFNHLTQQSHRVAEAADGFEALAMIDKEHYDLVLLDIMMPRLSGYEVCRRIRETYPVQELPVIFISARNRINDLVAGFESGANDYLTKPVSKLELLSRVDMHLRLLDVSRILEQKVEERTRALKTKNDELLRARNHMVMQEKMASVGMLASGVAHELRNPLNFINGFSEIGIGLCEELGEIQDKPDPEKLRELTEDLAENARLINEHGDRAARIIQNMLRLTGSSPRELRQTDLNELVGQFAELATNERCGPGEEPNLPVALETDFDKSIGEVGVDPRDISRVIINLVTNACESVRIQHKSDGQGRIKVTTRDLKDDIEIRIWDNGHGIPKDDRRRVFDPFFTTRSDSGHIGLGLPICYDIVVNGHQGSLTLKSDEESTEFTLVLPKTTPLVKNHD